MLLVEKVQFVIFKTIIASKKKFQGAELVLKFNSNISIYFHKVWNEVRLVGRSSAGILELKQNDGSWSKVCGDEFWTPDAAGVACHNLGFDRAYKPRTRVRHIPNSIISLLFLTIFERNILLKINIFLGNTTERQSVFKVALRRF